MQRRLPPLNALRAFEAAARRGTMTAAADELCVTPGAVSRQIASLESHLGVSLFEGSKVQPRRTEAATQLLAGISAAFDQIEMSVRAISDRDAGMIDVACFSTFAVRWLIPRLYDFHARWPDIEVRLLTADNVDTASIDRYDVVISVDSGAALQSTTKRFAPCDVLFPERLGPVLAPALATRLKIHTRSDLKNKTLLQTKNRLNAWQMWDSAFAMTPLKPLFKSSLAPSGAVFEHYYFTLEAAIGGLGIAIAPWHLVIDDVRAGRLVAPFGFCESGYRYVARRRSTAGVVKLDRFCRWLSAQALETPVP